MPQTPPATEPLMTDAEYQAMFRVEETLWWYRALRHFLADHMHRFPPAPAASGTTAPAAPNHRILDAGCGTGMNMLFYQQLGMEAHGFDLAPQAVEFCRTRGLQNVQQGSLLDIPHPDAHFDIVTLMDVLGMLPRDRQLKALGELFRVTRPGGIVLVHCAALEWLRSQHDISSNFQTRFHRPQLARLLRDAADQSGAHIIIERLTYRVSLLFPVMAAVKIARRITQALGAKPTSDQDLTPGLLNTPLETIMRAETKLLRHMNAPIGTSLFAAIRIH